MRSRLQEVKVERRSPGLLGVRVLLYIRVTFALCQATHPVVDEIRLFQNDHDDDHSLLSIDNSLVKLCTAYNGNSVIGSSS